MSIIKPIPYAVEGICYDVEKLPVCVWFKEDFEEIEEGRHCKLKKPSLNKIVGNCGANSEDKGIV